MYRRLTIIAAFILVTASGCGDRALPHEGKTVPELEKMLASSDTNAQAQGALGLSQHGAAAKSAVPALTELLSSPKAAVRQQAAHALGRIGPDAAEAVPALTTALADREWAVRRQAALALGGIGEAAGPALPELERLEHDSNKVVAGAARDARAHIDGPAK
jgi:HEAT repeat protein